MIKYIITFTFILAIFSIAHNASASVKTYEHRCNDGGIVYSNVSITPEGPFYTASQVFNAEGYFSSTCSPRKMKMVVYHDDGAEVALIPGPQTTETTVKVGLTTQFPMPSARKEFTSKTTPKSNPGYKVSFKTLVEEPDPYPYITNLVNYVPPCSFTNELKVNENDGFIKASRSEEVRQDALNRGVTRSDVTYYFTTRTGTGAVTKTSTLTGAFFPNDLQINLRLVGGDIRNGIDHSDKGACQGTGSISDGMSEPIIIDYY